MILRRFRLFIVATALIAAACSHSNVVPSGGGQMFAPQSVSPANAGKDPQIAVGVRR